ncbi:leukocyte immunoglobulin-like receptor subfamily A member 6 isoform X2 [Numida meleagris]|uniref:leukocyte immunoglobulin-like receptor subfamily A member 6 isoform X2 n=1 Tax=Numida meleagris TaxID=8996 RepID=UPI000B3D9F98|nr:leukocyte immunoglobulin-like receptor subfamily A member 6 isoform X2 [Numida meleagris]
MAPMALALILGWCLVAASRAQQLPRPSLSLHPSQGVSLRDSVTLWCHLPRPAARVELYKEGERTFKMSRDTDKEQDAVEFYLADIKQEDAVKYQCQYRVLEPPGTSEKSDPVALLVTDRSYPPPTISLSPEEHVEMGTNVTIRCWNKPYQGFTFLHKDGHSDPIQHQEPDGGGTATFTLFRVSPADSGTYRCSYRVGGCCLLFSPLGDNVTLEVIPTPAFPGDIGRPRWNLVAAVAGSCAAAIVVILILTLSFLLAAHRRRIQRNESPGAIPRSPKAVQFQVPPGDCEGLTYAELRAVTPGTCTPGPSAAPEPPIIYAEVGTGRPC